MRRLAPGLCAYRLGPNPQVLREALTETVNELIFACAVKLIILLGPAQRDLLVIMLLLILVRILSLFLIAILNRRVQLIIPPANVTPLLHGRVELLTTIEEKLKLI